MKFSDFLSELVADAVEAFKLSVLESEAHRKQHYEEKEGVLHHKTTQRMHPNGEVHEIPEKTQHAVDDFVVDSLEYDTTVDLYERRGQLRTAVKQRLFKRHPNVRVKVKLSREKPPEGVHSHIDSLNEHLKDNL